MEKRVETKLERFRIINGLNKKELAQYLGVSDVFVGKVCAGAYKLPAKHLARLINNDKGWDVAPLKDISEDATTFPLSEAPQLFGNREGIELLQRIAGVLSSVESSQKALLESLRMKDEQIASLTKIIDNLTKK